ncbi:hypothetical protein OUZ56_016980 [Daphnia magna]|uniref:Uncharacterized protein n=1 Tax=Daphnia magna TaxID=35525 RepID=A0ABR0ARW8_9CRUS|nr:hypothetical protein OUZ56_016980 [Daphnia magna]
MGNFVKKSPAPYLNRNKRYGRRKNPSRHKRSTQKKNFLILLESGVQPQRRLDYYSIRDIIRENGWDKSHVDALLCRLDAEDAELSKKDRSAINIAVGKWLYKHKGMNGMPKPAEFDMAAKSIVAHFPIAKDASSTADNIIHSSWYDVNTNVGRLSNYVRDRRSNNKNKGAIVRSYNKRQTENFEDEFDITLQDQERFMRENQVTTENKEKMMQCHFGTLESRRKWILEKKPTVTDILTRFPRFTSLKGAVDCDLKFVEGWRTEEFTERWKKIEKSLAVEPLKKHGESLEPFAELTMDLVDSYENSLLGLDTANDRTLIIFSSLPILFPPRPSRASKGFTLPNLKNISQILVRRFPVGTNLSEALQRCETDGIIQPGLIVIGNRRYIKADLIPIKINTPLAAESIAIFLISAKNTEIEVWTSITEFLLGKNPDIFLREYRPRYRQMELKNFTPSPAAFNGRFNNFYPVTVFNDRKELTKISSQQQNFATESD